MVDIVVRRILGICLVALFMSSVFGASAGAVGYVDGISDQHLGSWAGNFSEASGFSTPFPGFFANSWVGSPPSHIKLARYVVQWNVMSGAGYSGELTNLQSWYEHAAEIQLTPELALTNYAECSKCTAPKTSEEYTKELEALHSSFPDISVVEAWNEPNNKNYTSYLTPVAAAHFMNSAYAFCASHGCTAVAGDFLDSESNMVKYEEEYESNLNPRDPGNWGIHPYHAVKYESASTVTSFMDALPNPTTDHIWFTEVGAYYCQNGTTYGAASQEANAKYLVSTLIPAFDPLHVFYYQAAWIYDEKPPCGSTQADTYLYAAESTGGPVLARPTAKVIFGPEGAPTATTGLASGIEEQQAMLNGSLNPEGIDGAKYYFQYGTSTAYGLSTPEVIIGPGLNTVDESATITGLESGITYHFRMVATSAAGTSYGADETFNTPSRPWAVLTPSGQDVFYRGSNGAIWYWERSGSSWTDHEVGGSAVGSPTAAEASSTGNVSVVFRGTNGAIWADAYTYSTKTWGGVWELGGSAAGDPYMTAWGETSSIFFRGTNAAIWEWYWNGKAWSLKELGGSAAGTPSAATASSTGNMSVVFRGTNGGIWADAWTRETEKWDGVSELGGSAAGDPDFVTFGETSSIFFRGTNGAIWLWYWNGKAWSLKELGGSAVGTPSAAAASTGNMSVIFRGTNGAIWADAWTREPERWGGVWELGGSAAGDPYFIASGETSDEYFTGTNGEIWNWEWNGSAYNLTDIDVAPSVTTSAASGVQETQATLNGTLNPNGADTHYYFQYGTSTNYGASTSEVDAGSGTSRLLESAAITGLEAGRTYHYRLVASNWGGKSYGADETFNTPSRPWAVLTPSGQDVFYRGSNGAIWYWERSGSSWTDHEVGGSAVGSPTAAEASSTGNISVVFRGTNGAIWADAYTYSTKTWGGVWEIGGAAAGDPYITTYGETSSIFFRGTNGAIWLWYWNGKAWSLKELGGSAAGTPSAITGSSTGNMTVVFRGSNDAIWADAWTRSTEKWGGVWEIGGAAAGDPATTAYGETASIFFRGTNGAIWLWYWNGKAWSLKELGGSAAGTPSAATGSTGNMSVVFRGSNGGIWADAWTRETEKWGGVWELGGSAAGDPYFIVSGEASDGYYDGTNGEIWNWEWTGKAFSDYQL